MNRTYFESEAGSRKSSKAQERGLSSLAGYATSYLNFQLVCPLGTTGKWDTDVRRPCFWQKSSKEFSDFSVIPRDAHVQLGRGPMTLRVQY